LALDATLASPPSWGKFVTREALQRLSIGFEPPGTSIPYPDQAPAAACVSIDFDSDSPDRRAANHQGTYALVELSERYGIPLTWAICGKNAEEDMDAYVKLVGSSVKPEIGIHTYSHIDVSKSSPEVLEAEIERCVAALGLTETPRTFIFPWNREGQFPVLAKMGFVAYRGARNVIGGPVKMNGLWNIPPVYYVSQRSMGARSLITRYVDVCLRYRSTFHLWLHPWSIVKDGSAAGMVRTTLDPVFAYLKEKREEGLLSTTTMGTLAVALQSGSAS